MSAPPLFPIMVIFLPVLMLELPINRDSLSDCFNAKKTRVQEHIWDIKENSFRLSDRKKADLTQTDKKREKEGGGR